MAFWNRKKSPPSPASDASSFGAIAVAKRFITLGQLQEALECMGSGVTKLGEQLVHMGFMTEFQKEEVLVEQQHLRGAKRRDVMELELDRQKRLTTTIRTSLADLTNTTHKLTAALKK